MENPRSVHRHFSPRAMTVQPSVLALALPLGQGLGWDAQTHGTGPVTQSNPRTCILTPFPLTRFRS